MDRNQLQESNYNANVHGGDMQSGNSQTIPRKPHPIIAVIMALIIFASAVLPGWSVINTEIMEYVGQGPMFDQSGQLQIVPEYAYRAHGTLNFSMFLKSNDEHYTVECSPMANSLAIFTFVFFILSFAIYVTELRIQYTSFMINGVSIASVLLMVFQACCFNQDNVTVACRDNIQTHHTMGVIWWVSLIFLVLVAIYNIMRSKKITYPQKTELSKNMENVYQTIVDACDLGK